MLPEEVLSRRRARAIRDRFAGARERLDPPRGVLVHGDFRFQNTLVEGARVSAILDWEMAISGDPAMDLAWLYYSDGKEERDLAAIRRGYGEGASLRADAGFTTRLLLYQVRYAISHLGWEVGFRDEAGIATVLARLRGFEEALDTLYAREGPEAGVPDAPGELP
jgi:aminoglycoside phosphotransferase (APT) family kinase protein